MPRITPACVVSFSSEDPYHPSSNLLKKESFRKWKCKDEGEKEAVAIFKLDKAEIFTGFNIANENSAFIEIFVARSGVDPVKYESILSQSQLMSPSESRNGENISGIKFFNSFQLNKIVAVEKWDIVKVVCCQPFNTHVQYGLSFIEFNVLADPNEKVKIGGFGLRAPLGGSDDEDDRIPVGSFFNKLKSSPVAGSSGALFAGDAGNSSPLSTGAAIRQASTSLANAAISSSEAKVKELLRKRKLDVESSSDLEHLGPKKQIYGTSQASSKGQNDDPLPKRNTLVDSPLRLKQKNNITSSTASSNPQGRLSSVKKPNGKNESERVGSSANSQSSSGGTSGNDKDRSNLKQKVVPAAKPATSKSVANRKQFGKLFEGVIFVMSGFENPYRTELRNKALDMGARFKGDWDSTCTHLLCAFVNTPKFRQVKSSGRGKIVKKEWVEASHAARCRFPWRRYCMDRDDKGVESEDEILSVIENGSGEEQILVQPTSNTSSAEFSNRNQEQEIESNRETAEDSETGDEEEFLQHQVSSQPQQKSEGENEQAEEENRVKKRKRVRVFDSDDEEEEEKQEHEAEKKDGSECGVYDVDTDVDEDKKEERVRKTTNDSSPEKKSNNESRNDFFQDCVFLLHPYDSPPLNPTQRDQIEQIISRHKGKVEHELTSDVEYIVTENEEWDDDFAEALSENPNLSFVRCQWIFECGRKEQMISPEPFMILPN